nr:thiolase family protein [Acidihalobacter yilgarnensis]
MAQRACGTGLELLVQAADAIELGRARTVLCVGAESMSRNPMTSYTHRRDEIGSTECRDFLWEALRDTACDLDMGGTAECLAKQYDIDRRAVDIYAARSFMRALDAREAGFLDDEMVSLQDEDFECGDLVPRHLRLRGAISVDCDSHPRHSPVEILGTLKPVFGGVQTAGNSAGICDGAAAALVTGGRDTAGAGRRPLARLVAAAIVGVAPREMGIGPVAAIHRLLAAYGLKVGDIDRVEINEAFAAQVLACVHALGIDESRLNVNGGAIAFGHPLAATGLRLAMHCARELARCGGRFGIVSACIGGGQGIALLLECTGAWSAES